MANFDDRKFVGGYGAYKALNSRSNEFGSGLKQYNDEYKKEHEDDESNLSASELKIIDGYNNPKNEQTFKQSREYLQKIIDDPNNKDNALAKKLAPYIITDPKKAKYTESGVARALDNVGEFVQESNKNFFGKTIEDAAQAVNFVGSGFNGKEADKRTADFMRTTGQRDANGMNALETTKVTPQGFQRRSDQELQDQLYKDQNSTAAKAGRVSGDAQRIAADIATTVIPGVGAEKVIRGLSAFDKLSKANRFGKVAGEVVANVGSGLASTAAGGIKDPTSLTPGNIGVNAALDASLGVVGSTASSLFSTIRKAKNAGELDTALKSLDTSTLPKKFSDQLDKLRGSDLKPKDFKAEVANIVDSAKKHVKYDTLADGATLKNANIKSRIDDIDNRLSQADDPKYAQENGLMNDDAATAKYDELMGDAQKIPGVPEASQAVTEADAQIAKYNEMRVDNPFAKKVDAIRERMKQIENARTTDRDHLQSMREDTESGFDPQAIDDLHGEANANYDKMIKGEQDKLDELLSKNPDQAAELHMLDEAQKNILTQRQTAQQSLDDLTAKQHDIASSEAEKIAQTPNEEAVAQHKQLLQEKKDKLTQRYEDAKKRYEAPNESLQHVDDELTYLNDGTHPLIADGASREKVMKKYMELDNERARFESKEIAESNPNIPKSEGDQELVLSNALNEVATAKVGFGARIGRIWSQPANQLRAAGFGKLADQRTDAIMQYNRQAFDNKNTIKDWGKQAKGNSSKDMFRAANGDQGAYEKLTPGARLVIDDWRKQAYNMGKAMGLPEEVLAEGNYIPHLFTDVKKNPKLLDLQQKLVRARKDIVDLQAGKTTDTTHVDDLGDAQLSRGEGNGTVSQEDIATITANHRKRFGNSNVKKVTMADDSIEGAYTAKDNTVRISDKADNAVSTADHEDVHNAIAQHLDDNEIQQLYKDIVEVRGGKEGLVAKYEADGYKGIDWEGAANEELANTFVDFRKQGFVASDKNVVAKIGAWLEKTGLPASVAKVFYKVAAKMEKTPTSNIEAFYKKLDEGGFRGAETKGNSINGEPQLKRTESPETAIKRKNTYIEKLQESIRAITENPNILTADDFIKETGEYNNRFLKERYGAEGYQEDFYKAADAYMSAANTKVNLEPVMNTFAAAKQLTPEKGMQKFLQTEIDKMRGTKADVDRGLDDWFNSVTKGVAGGRLNNLGTRSLRGFRSAMSLSHIGFSANSAINTLSQIAILPGSVNIDGSLYGLTKGMQLTAKLAKNTLTRQETEEFTHMARMGVFEGSSHILPEETAAKYMNGFNKTAFAGITGADRFLRMSTYYGAKLKADRMGLDKIASERYIYERVNEVNQNFSKLEAPHAFRSQVAKTMGSMVTFVPGMVVRSVEIGAKSLKGAGDIVAHTVKGEPITRADFMRDVDDISKGVFTLAAVWGAGNVIGAITGQDEIVPNPFNAQTYNSPALQFIFGSDTKTGVMGTFTNQSGDQYDENGNNVTRNDRTAQFWTELMPSFLVPGYSQLKRSSEGMKVSEQGYSETDKGGMRFQTDPSNDLQRNIFGQYSTPEGRDYIKNMGKPGGGALSETESTAIKNAPVNQQNQYYDFFKQTDKLTGRTEANKEVTQLFRDGRPAAARRKANEYNNKVKSTLSDFFVKYPNIDDDLKDKLKSNVYITLTDSSESARTHSDE